MGYTVDNYRKEGGDEWVVGGTLNLASGSELQLGGTAVNPAHYIGGAETQAEDATDVPITGAVVSKTSGSDSEALTLADGTAGLLVVSLTDAGGGACTITPDTATGWATIVLTVAGDSASLMYVNDTVGWIILGLYALDGHTAEPTFTQPS